MTLFIAYLLNIIDYLFTSYWVRLYGIDIEANPIGRWMFENGVAGIYKTIIVGVLFLILALLRKNKMVSLVSVGLTIFYALIVIYHIIIWVQIQ
jgi:hypothetical protein